MYVVVRILRCTAVVGRGMPNGLNRSFCVATSGGREGILYCYRLATREREQCVVVPSVKGHDLSFTNPSPGTVRVWFYFLHRASKQLTSPCQLVCPFGTLQYCPQFSDWRFRTKCHRRTMVFCGEGTEHQYPRSWYIGLLATAGACLLSSHPDIRPCLQSTRVVTSYQHLVG